MNNEFINAPILDPDDYNPNEYTEGQKVRIKDGSKLENGIITYVDYTTGSVGIEFYNEDGENIDKDKITL